MTFVGRIAVVTGGASGIGAACCQMLAARGARVVVADLDRARAEALAAKLGGLALALDVSTRDANEAAAAEVETRLGPVDLLVTSAGIIQRPVRADADTLAVPQVVSVEVRSEPGVRHRILFDPGHGLEERLIVEQFA